MTAKDIIRRALLLIGAVDSGETLEADMAADGLSALQDMIESWSNDDLLIPYISTESYALTPGQASYTYGTGGDFNAEKPMEIIEAYLRDANNDDLPIKIISQETYNNIVEKGASGIPSQLYYVPETLGKVYLDQAPSSSYTLYMDVQKALSSPSALTTTLAFPNGYNRALRYNLAIELAPEYKVSVKPEVIKIAEESKSQLERQNLRVPIMKSDYQVKSTFNINTGY